MFIYWGGINGGKIHMRNYAIINSKNVLAWQHIGGVIRKRKFNVNFSPLDSTKPIEVNNREGIDWVDLNVDHIYYHKHRNYDGLKSNSYSEHKIQILGRDFTGFCYSNMDVLTEESVLEDRKVIRKIKNSVLYKEKDVEKYTKEEYLNTLIYHEMLCKHKKQFCEPTLYDDVLKEHYDEIFDDVDLVTHPYMWHEDIVKSNLQRIRKANNIVPIKSNKLHQTITFLHDYPVGRWDYIDGIWANRADPVGLFDAPKEKIWAYLDEWNNDINVTTSLLKKYDIPFQYFDLDLDSYKDTFGWDIELNRTTTYFDTFWNEEKYKKAEIIAKEYLVKDKTKY